MEGKKRSRKKGGTRRGEDGRAGEGRKGRDILCPLTKSWISLLLLVVVAVRTV